MPKLIDISQLLKTIVQGLESWNQPDAALIQGVSTNTQTHTIYSLPRLQRLMGGGFTVAKMSSRLAHINAAELIAESVCSDAIGCRAIGPRLLHQKLGNLLIGLFENFHQITGQYRVLADTQHTKQN